MSKFFEDLEDMIKRTDKIKLDSYTVFLGSKVTLDTAKESIKKLEPDLDLSRVIFHVSDYLKDGKIYNVEDDKIKRDFLKMNGIDI